MTFSDTTMMELGITQSTNIHNTRLLIRTLKYVLDILQMEEAFTVEEYKHTHTHHSSNSNTEIVHNSVEHFLWNLSDFSSDDVLSCLWIVFTISVFQVPPQKIVRWVEILGIGCLGVISCMQYESVP